MAASVGFRISDAVSFLEQKGLSHEAQAIKGMIVGSAAPKASTVRKGEYLPQRTVDDAHRLSRAVRDGGRLSVGH